MNQNELMHYGVLGMKWGVRRYQNEDGSYKKGAKDRYSKAIKKYAGNIAGTITEESRKKDIGRKQNYIDELKYRKERLESRQTKTNAKKQNVKYLKQIERTDSRIKAAENEVKRLEDLSTRDYAVEKSIEIAEKFVIKLLSI